MSAIPAGYPAYSPRDPQGHPLGRNAAPHIEIVSTRSQRRARPRLIAAIVTVAGLFAILIAQLLLTIATSQGAYEISSLQSRQAGLALDRQVLAEQMHVLGAPQHLAAEAQAMGMVINSSSAAFLRLADSSVHGTAAAANASAVLRTAPDGSPLIPDSLLAGVPLVNAPVSPTTPAGTTPTPGAAGNASGFTAAPSAGATAGSPGGSATAGAPATPVGATSVASTGSTAIPSPKTR